MENNPVELCVVCGKQTAHRFNDHVDMRYGYVDGVGQTCKKCYELGTNRDMVCVPGETILNKPNNYDLGAEVRSMYYSAKKEVNQVPHSNESSSENMLGLVMIMLGVISMFIGALVYELFK